MALLPTEIGVEQICISATQCSTDSRTYMQWLGGAGFSAMVNPAPGYGWSPYARALLEPVWGRISRDRGTRTTTSFGVAYGGAAFGVAKGRFRADLEAGLAPNVAGAHPRIWSLQVGFTR